MIQGLKETFETENLRPASKTQRAVDRWFRAVSIVLNNDNLAEPTGTASQPPIKCQSRP